MPDLGIFVAEQVAPGVLKERSSNGEMVMFHIDDGGQKTVAAWADAVADELEHWPSGVPCLFLHDLHKSGILAFGSEMQADFERLFHLRPDLTRFVAVIMPANDSVAIARLDCLMREFNAAAGYPVKWEIFTARKPALAWLYQQMA